MKIDSLESYEIGLIRRQQQLQQELDYDPLLEGGAIISPSLDILWEGCFYIPWVIPPEIKPLFKANVFTHYHPDGSSFSMWDIISSLELIVTQLRVVTDHCRFIIYPKSGIWPSLSTINKKIQEIQLSPEFLENNFSFRERNPWTLHEFYYSHLKWKMMAEKLNLIYNYSHLKEN